MKWRVLLLVACLALPANAEEELPSFDAAKTKLEAAANALEDARRGQDRLAALGKAVAAHEYALRSFRRVLRLLSAREADLTRALEADRQQMEGLLGALQSLSRAPKSALMVYPGGPVAAMRSAGVMAQVSPALQQETSDLRDRLRSLREVRARQSAARVEIRGSLANLQDLRAQTAEALKRRKARGLPSRDQLRAQARLASESAQNLAELSAVLGPTNTTQETPLLQFSEARGLISLPVQGRVVARFGDADPWGRPGSGITVEASAFAQIYAPWDGTIRFAGKLIDYGNVVILETDPATLIVMAGIATTEREPGETVLTGEPLGDLGGVVPTSDEFLLEETTDRDEIGTRKLYIEIRRGGEAEDPAAWFDMTEEENGK